MAGAVGQQEIEDAEQGNLYDVGGLVEYGDDQEEDLLDASFVFIYNVNGKVNCKITGSFRRSCQLIRSLTSVAQCQYEMLRVETYAKSITAESQKAYHWKIFRNG